MELKGRALNSGAVSGEAIVVENMFSFIGDMDPKTGMITMVGSPTFGQSLAGKVLVFKTGRGGTIAPYMLYEAHKNGVAPAAVLCNEADLLTLECALTVNLPIMDRFNGDITALVKTGDQIMLQGDGAVHVDRQGPAAPKAE